MTIQIDGSGVPDATHLILPSGPRTPLPQSGVWKIVIPGEAGINSNPTGSSNCNCNVKDTLGVHILDRLGRGRNLGVHILD